MGGHHCPAIPRAPEGHRKRERGPALVGCFRPRCWWGLLPSTPLQPPSARASKDVSSALARLRSEPHAGIRDGLRGSPGRRRACGSERQRVTRSAMANVSSLSDRVAVRRRRGAKVNRRDVAIDGRLWKRVERSRLLRNASPTVRTRLLQRIVRRLAQRASLTPNASRSQLTTTRDGLGSE